jgi:NitT/TauT family transport system permease protein
MSLTLSNVEERSVTPQETPVAVTHSASRKRATFVYSARLFTLLPPLLLGAIILVSWYASTTSGAIPADQLPSLAAIGSVFWESLTSGLFLTSAWVTIQESLGGFLLAVLIALPVGFALTRWRLFAATVQPYLVAGQAIPAIVIAPFLVLWMGYGMGPIVVVCTLVVLFPMIITTALGFQTIERELTEAARVEGASFWPMLGYIQLPLALPAIMAAVRTGLTLSIVGALVGEFVSGGDQGLGALVQIAKSQYNISLMFATVAVLAILAVLFYGIARGLTMLSEIVHK